MQRSDYIDENMHIIEWRIKNFSSCNIQHGEKLECPIAIAGNLFHTHWTLYIYPNGKDDPNFLSCYVRRENTEDVGPKTMHVVFAFSLMTFDGVEAYTKRGSDECERSISNGFSKFIKLETIFSSKKSLLQLDTLVLKCTLRMLGPKEKQTFQQIFRTEFPIEKLSTRLTLDSFRGTTKQNPQIFCLKDSNDLLSLNVSMNKDETSKDQVQEATVEVQNPESFLHIVMTKKKAKDPMYISCWIKAFNYNLDVSVDKEINHLFSKTDEKEEWILPYFIDTDDLRHDCNADDALLFDFEFTIHRGPLSEQMTNLEPLELREDPMESTLMKDLEEMHETSKFSDVILRVEDETFPVHKSILAARSPRFQKIFTSLTKETTKSGQNIAEIVDVDKKTMARLLKFIYTDTMEDTSDEKCLLLYSAAKKYQMWSLQVRCTNFLKKKLSIKSIFKVLMNDEAWDDSDLKLVVLDRIAEHYEYVFLTPEWGTVIEEHEKVANQVLTYVRFKKRLQLEG